MRNLTIGGGGGWRREDWEQEIGFTKRLPQQSPRQEGEDRPCIYSKSITAIRARRWSSAPTPERGRGVKAYLPQNPISYMLHRRKFLPQSQMSEMMQEGKLGRVTDMWRPYSQDGSRHVSHNRWNILPPAVSTVPMFSVKLIAI